MNLLEFAKANKKRILKGALIVGGSIVGLAIGSKMITTKENDEIETVVEDAEVKDSNEEVVEETPSEN
jgi:hypothetical protein